MSTQKRLKHAKTDPKVNCPIVCGEYMRATGFFFQVEDRTYLITARHNVLPTVGSKLKTNKLNLGFTTYDFLPVIDIYLRTSSGFETKRIDIEKQPGVKQTPEIDIIGIPVDFRPEKYGYQVWGTEDIANPTDAPETLDTIGFNGACFPHPDRDYTREIYQNNIRNPIVVRLVNEMLDVDDLYPYGLTAVAIDENNVGEYDGLSGAAVLGNGLVGIHAADIPTKNVPVEKYGFDEFRLLVYWRAEILPKLLVN
jgi:hypothetical protein